MEYPKVIEMRSLCCQTTQQTKYEFIGLSQHMGISSDFGHYTAISLRNGKYYKFDDEKFSEITEKEALS